MPRTKKDAIFLTQGEAKALVTGRSAEDIGKAMIKKFQVGRRAKDLDFDLVVKMRMAGCPDTEIAAELNIDVKTLTNKLKQDPLFAAVYERADDRGRSILRRRQFVKAVDGDNTMLIWLGKNRLGQKDRIEDTGRTDRLDEVVAAIFGVAAKPPVDPEAAAKAAAEDNERPT